jgi:hypothetical protein
MFSDTGAAHLSEISWSIISQDFYTFAASEYISMKEIHCTIQDTLNKQWNSITMKIHTAYSEATESSPMNDGDDSA